LLRCQGTGVTTSRTTPKLVARGSPTEMPGRRLSSSTFQRCYCYIASLLRPQARRAIRRRILVLRTILRQDIPQGFDFWQATSTKLRRRNSGSGIAECRLRCIARPFSAFVVGATGQVLCHGQCALNNPESDLTKLSKKIFLLLEVQGAHLMSNKLASGKGTSVRANPHLDFAKRDDAKDEYIRVHLARATAVCLFCFGIHQPPNRYNLGTVDSKEPR
jgi:hypothetical protein